MFPFDFEFRFILKASFEVDEFVSRKIQSSFLQRRSQINFLQFTKVNDNVDYN